MENENIIVTQDRVFAFVQARMNSTRLPGKTMKKLAGTPVISWVVNRAKKIDPAVEVVVLTGETSQNDPIRDWCDSQSIQHFSGSEDDVLSRFFFAAKHYSANTILRLTADNPLVDFRLARSLIILHLLQGNQYSSSKEEFGSNFPVGIGCEVFSYETLDLLFTDESSDDEKEHVNEKILKSPSNFKTSLIGEPVKRSDYNFSIDSSEDFKRLEAWIQIGLPTAAHQAEYWRQIMLSS